MRDSKDKRISPADEIKCMSALKSKMIVGDYNKVIASMREIAAIEQAIEEKDNASKNKENLERE
ncbi:MAG: hypothetical protein J6J36_08990 [Clostridia bacterium]|nr:hypothetical protein [Clostridia bacterium]